MNHQLCVVTPDGKQLLETRISHDVAVLRQLDQHLNGYGTRIPGAIERSEGLLVEHTHNCVCNPRTRRAGIEVDKLIGLAKLPKLSDGRDARRQYVSTRDPEPEGAR